jgi:hypothetical protein
LKYAPLAGITAALLLILFCFIPWAFYPDLQQNFTGFYSKQNNYGRPGIAFVFLSVIAIILFAITKLWARRVNQFIAVLIFAYALKTYFLFAACYQGICPQIKLGLIGVPVFSFIILISSLLSKAKIKTEG